MKSIIVVLLLSLATLLWAEEGDGLYSIDADGVRKDSSNGVTTYEGNARAELSNLAIEADTISIFRDNGLPTRVEASGDPLKFRHQASADNVSGTAKRIIFLVPELKLTLIDYVIADPAGNKIKGDKASIVLSP